jgi:NADH:ubiquinone oxidoreductase subunit
MNELEEVYRDLKASAKMLGTPYEKVSIDELANKYCEATDNQDDYTRDIYFSALILRFWFKISKMYAENRTLQLSYTDYFDWLTGAIIQACAPDARAWQKDSKLSAQQVINQILATRFVAQAYYESNLLKNKGKLSTCSLDEELDDESGLTIGDRVADDEGYAAPEDTDDKVRCLIQDFIYENKLLEAIIFDNIAYKDCYKHEKKVIRTTNLDGEKVSYTRHMSTFWPYKLVKELRELDAEYATYFMNEYHVSTKAFEAAFNTLQKANSQKKYKIVENALADLKKYVAATV